MGFSIALLGFAVCLFGVLIFLHARFLYLARKQQQLTTGALDSTERQFQSVFKNALDTIMIVDRDGICRDANPAAEQLLGRARLKLIPKPLASFYRSQEEFTNFWRKIEDHEDRQGRTELVKDDGSVVVVEFTAKCDFVPGMHVLILRDITRRLKAEQEVEANLTLARSAWTEAEAMRAATLALTQNLRMDLVLDRLLQSLHQLVPYQFAQVLLVEAPSRLFLVRESLAESKGSGLPRRPTVIGVSDNIFLEQALTNRDGVLVSDVVAERGQHRIDEYSEVRSWLGVPLVASDQTIGLLTLSHSEPDRFTPEHLRLARSLAIAAAIAIQNARLFERTEIYGEELERRLSDLRSTKQALDEAEQDRAASEDRFQKVFRSSPIAFSITTLSDGRYLDVNEAFERRYGYTRSELLGRTSGEIGIWEDVTERTRLVEQLNQGAVVRNSVTRLRTKTGKLVYSLYSADTVQLEGKICLLIVSDDLPQCDGKSYN